MKKIKILLLLIFMILISQGCTKNEEKIIGYYRVKNKIDLEKKALFNHILKTKDGFIGANLYTKNIELYSNSGELLATYDKKGKGPGRYGNPFEYRPYFKDNMLFVIDGKFNKILVLKLKNNEKDYRFKFQKEIIVDEGEITNINVYNGKLFVSTLYSKHRLYLYDIMSEKIIKKYFPVSEKTISNSEKMIKNDLYVNNVENILLVAEQQKFKLNFYKILDDYNLEKIKSINTHYINENSFERRRDRGFSLKGIYTVQNTNANFIITFDPKMNIKKSFFEVYSKNGEYLGKYLIDEQKEYKRRVLGYAFYNNTNKLYCQWAQREDGDWIDFGDKKIIETELVKKNEFKEKSG